MDLVFHILVPLGLLALLGIRNKWIFLLLPLTIILDLGTFFDFRRGLHSIFALLLILAIIFLICKLKNSKETKMVVGISAFYLVSHMFLDIGGPMALFWPFSLDAYILTIKIVIENLFPSFIFKIEVMPIGILEQRAGAIVTEAGFGLIFSLLALLIAKKILKK